MNVLLGLLILLAIVLAIVLLAKTFFGRLVKNGNVNVVVWLGSLMTGFAVFFLLYSVIKFMEAKQFAMMNMRYKAEATEKATMAKAAQTEAVINATEAQRQAQMAQENLKLAQKLQEQLDNCR